MVRKNVRIVFLMLLFVSAQMAHSLYADADDMLLELITRAALNP